MQNEEYRYNLKAALKNLIQVNSSIFDSVVNVSMQGELEEWNDLVPVGDTYEFDFDLFKSCEDINIQLLVKLIETVDETYETIKNLNSIQMED